MSKLNKAPVATRITPKYGYSENANLQFVKDAPAKFFEYVVSSFYGEDASKQKEMFDFISSAVNQGSARAVANVILFAKNELGMRTMPIVAAVHLVKQCRGRGVTDVSLRNLISGVIVRADELCDLYAYALSVFGSKNSIPLSIKRGVEDAFGKFNEYDLAKYNRDGQVSLADLLRIVHPTPTISEMGRVYKQIIDGTLAAPYTWEVEFSRNGQRHPSEQVPKAKLWSQILTAQSLGFLAAIRNIRNMAEAGIDKSTQRLLSAVISKGHRKVLPFQIFQAYKMTPDHFVEVKDSLVDAAERSVANVPVVGEKVWMVVDVSGSMRDTVNDKSDFSMLSTAAQLAATVVKSQLISGKEVALTCFATRAVTMQFSRHDTVLSIATKIEEMTSHCGGSTDLDCAFAEYPAVTKLIGKPDTFMVFSDMQVNDRNMFARGAYSWNSFGQVQVGRPDGIPAHISAIPLKVAVNFRSKETTPLAKHMGFVQLSGFSEKIFQLLNVLRNQDKIFSRLATN